MKVQEIVKVLGDFRLKKTKGQNFLINKNVAVKMIEALEIEDKDNVLEIGPGLGSLTEEIVKKVGSIICVEIERRFSEYLKDRFKDKIILINDDFLRRSEEELGFPEKIIGSLPYNGAKRIIYKILVNYNRVKRCVFLLQREVADCILSNNNSKNYGPLTVIAHLRSEIKRIGDVSPDSFFPKPSVQSRIILLDFKSQLINGGFQGFLKMVFKQRRKTISNNLKGFINVNINKRAEELTPEELHKLYLEIKKDLLT